MHHKWTENGPISRHFHWFVQFNFRYDLNILHAWGAVDLRIYLAHKNHGYSISAQSYDFVLTWKNFITLSHMSLQVHKYTSVQVHAYTSTQIYMNMAIQVHKYTSTQEFSISLYLKVEFIEYY